MLHIYGTFLLLSAHINICVQVRPKSIEVILLYFKLYLILIILYIFTQLREATLYLKCSGFLHGHPGMMKLYPFVWLCAEHSE